MLANGLMFGYLLANIPLKLAAILHASGDLFGLFFLSVKRCSTLISAPKRAIFWLLFKRQLFNIALKSIYINVLIALLLSSLVMSRAYTLLPEGMLFSDYYAKFFVTVVVREVGPMFSALILIARSATAITFEMGHLKLHNQFEALKAQGMDPLAIFLLPVLFAFPLSLLMMQLIFVLVCLFSSYLFINFSYQADLPLQHFVQLISTQISAVDVITSILKVLFGGILIGLICIYFGSKVGNRFTEISRAIASATSLQLLLVVSINVALSIVGYL
ncbi:hypothetical protein AX660_13920 [Paraglaciecola hydrolytica]|uniref:ABC transporter permease n=2 Tax=Paraglaciecola hydrolytica TaxID=1799789 RepID=A0A136A1X6_9ALTE|nr:hypothetical protein AX660_13920 [Paraglaciecola hydrolytica]